MTSHNINPKENPKHTSCSGRQIGKHLLKVVTAAAFLGLIFWLLWNWAGVPLFTFPPLTYWQALGAIVMTGFLVCICILAAGRHRGHSFNHAAHNSCLFGRCRSENGPRDI